MNIEYRIKNVYGNDMMYPANRDAHFIAEINNTKTLPDYLFKTIKLYYPNSTFTQVL